MNGSEEELTLPCSELTWTIPGPHAKKKVASPSNRCWEGLRSFLGGTKWNFVRAEVADTIRRCRKLTMIHYDFDNMDVQCQICSANRIRHAVSHSVGLKRLPFIFPTFPTFPTLKYVPLILVFWLQCRAYQGAGLRHIQCFSVFWCRGCCKNFPEVLLVKVVPMFQVDSFSNGGALDRKSVV